MRRAGALVLAGVASLIVPAGASAATVSISFSELRINAGAGEANVVTIARSGGTYVVSDTGVAPVAGFGCAPFGTAVACPAEGITSIEADLNNLDDTATLAASVVGNSNFDVRLNGESGEDTLNAGPKVDSTLDGGSDNDTLNGSAQRDRIDGDDGGDVMNGGAGNDQIEGNAGNDTAFGGEGDDEFDSDSIPDGADSFQGGPGFDAFTYNSRDVALRVDTDGVADDGEACPGLGCEGDNVAAAVEQVNGGRGGDVLIGGEGSNELNGNSGADLLDGGAGDDDLDGSDGDDRLLGRAGDDLLDGEGGADRMFAGAGDDELEATFFPDEADVYSGGKGIDLGLFDGDYDKRIDLDSRADDGAACPGAACEGDNVRADMEDLVGGEGRDVFFGGKGANDFIGVLGNDRLVGNGGPDGLFGEDGRDVLTGGSGIDSLDGGSGADRLASRDKSRDEVVCGSSGDRVKADRRDRVARDCDRVRIGRRR